MMELVLDEVVVPASPRCFTGAAVAGALLGVATVMLEDRHWRLCGDETRLFHLDGRTQGAARALARDLYAFVKEAGIAEVAFCRTGTGYRMEGVADEARIESVVQLLPSLSVETLDNETIRQWSLDSQIPLPVNIGAYWRGLVQTRSIEAAQYKALQEMRD